VFVIGQAVAATFDTQNTVVPPSGVAIGLLIAISLSFDRDQKLIEASPSYN